VFLNILYGIIVLYGAIYAYKHQYLTKNGGFAAFFVGIGIAIGFGYKGLIILALFFITSSMLSKYKKQQKNSMEERTEKGSTRDFAQVFANGGLAAICGIAFWVTKNSIWITIFTISLASANSDTWASEIGSLSKSKPYSIKTFKKISTGTSGAISLLGTLASIIGSFVIAIASYVIFPISSFEFIIIFIFGFVGSCIDTLLGAFVQAEYKCKECQKIYEVSKNCHDNTVLVKGFSFFQNDTVNFLSGLLAALIAYILIKFI